MIGMGLNVIGEEQIDYMRCRVCMVQVFSRRQVYESNADNGNRVI